MWLMTTVGFFAVIQKDNDSFLTVRTRVAEDLEQLRARYMPELSSTVLGGGTDYPYRATISYDDFGRGLAQIVKDIHYDSFRNEIGRLMGFEREQIYTQVWNQLKNLEPNPFNQPVTGIETEGAGKRLAFGGIVINNQNKVLLKESKDNFEETIWTFPKGNCHTDETPEQAVVREVQQETGIIGRIERQIPGSFESESTLNTYYLMSFENETDWEDLETVRIRWASQEEAQKLIEMTQNDWGRIHDLEVLRLAYELQDDSQ